jgi:hypothetical protein
MNPTMRPPPTPAGPSRKRTAPPTSPPALNDPSDDTPRILRRYRHRKRNIALPIWGPDVPLTPSSSSRSTLPSTHGHTNTPAAAANPRTPRARFNAYKALLRHPTLFFPLVLALPLPCALALYAIDKEFHYRFNLYSVSLLHAYATRHAPVASRVFSWILHPGVCISDPMLRPMDGRSWLARDVPGWRWVGMCVARQTVVRRVLGEVGCPRGWEEVVCKMWGVMEMKTTAVRLAFLRDADIWTDADLLLATAFLVKLDMRFSDPVTGNGMAGLSHMLLTQKSLTTLANVLTGKVTLDYDDATMMLVRTYPMGDLDADGIPWLDDEVDNGVPWEEWGLLMKEGWTQYGARMESVVDMIITEGIRRELHIQQDLLDFVMCGYVDREGKNLPIKRRARREKKMVGKEGWKTKLERRHALDALHKRFMGVELGDESGHAMDTDE